MDRRIEMKVTIETLHELVDELDYYRLLKLDRGCPQAEIGSAFRRESRFLHPDRLAALEDVELKEKANYIFTAVNEAFRTLRDPDTRSQYDLGLDRGIIRISETALKRADQVRQSAIDPEQAATHPGAEKFWRMALRDWRDQKYKGCAQNIKFALQYEPRNETFLEWLKKAEAAILQDRQENPYKVR